LRELFDGYKHQILLEYIETGVMQEGCSPGEGVLASRQNSTGGSEADRTLSESQTAEADRDVQRPELSIVCRLVVNNVIAEDCGEVECPAFNTGGMDATRAQLSMHGQLPTVLSGSCH
jgi:hypothetical protein